MTRVLVTGANGHLGANTVRALLAKKHEVIAFVRPSSDLQGLIGLPITIKFGDIQEKDSVMAAAAECQVIIHSAAVFRFWVADPQEIYNTSCLGMWNILQAAKRFNLRRLIYTSSTYAIGFTNDPEKPRTAQDWNDDAVTPYSQAKTKAEKEAWRLAAEYGVPMISLCPAGLWGPYDYRITPAMRWIRDLVNGMTPVIDTGGSFVDVRDAAEIHARAVTMGQPGCRYAIVGADLLNRQIADIVTQLTGVKHLYLNLPAPLMHSVAGMMEYAARVSGWDPLSTRTFIDEALGRYLFVDAADTNEVFGIIPREEVAMITGAIRWLLFTGQIGKRRAKRLAPLYPPEPDW
jgi:dihydroflavonol-4-reductase